jgi:uncharacterized membrane protein YeaQ/YmgE (transglycosylase-associated protein family)
MMSDSIQEAGVAAEENSGEGVMYCAVHPTVETSLRCNKCGRPMCSKCAVRTPVGYRCKECVRGQQDVYFKAGQRDYVVAAVVSFVLSLIASFIVPPLGLFFTIILAPVVGSVIAQAVHRATGRRRGRYTGYVVLGGLIVGMLPAIIPVIEMLLIGAPAQAAVTVILGPALFIGIAAAVAFGWFRYGR